MDDRLRSLKAGETKLLDTRSTLRRKLERLLADSGWSRGEVARLIERQDEIERELSAVRAELGRLVAAPD